MARRRAGTEEISLEETIDEVIDDCNKAVDDFVERKTGKKKLRQCFEESDRTLAKAQAKIEEQEALDRKEEAGLEGLMRQPADAPDWDEAADHVDDKCPSPCGRPTYYITSPCDHGLWCKRCFHNGKMKVKVCPLCGKAIDSYNTIYD